MIDNASLLHLDELSGLNTIGKGITMDGNSMISNITGLANVSSMGGSMEIVNNTALTNCEIAILCTYLTEEKQAIINNNGTGCATSEEILIACNTDPCTTNPSTVDFDFSVEGNTVILAVDTSNAPNITNYIWTFGDGALGSGLTPTNTCLLYTSPSPRDATLSRMPSSA